MAVTLKTSRLIACFRQCRIAGFAFAPCLPGVAGCPGEDIGVAAWSGLSRTHSTSLRRQRSGLLLLILPWDNPELMEVMAQEAYRLGYRLMTNFLTRPDLDREIALLNNSLDWQVEGLFWLPYANLSAYPELLLQRLRGNKARLVFMQRRLPDFPGCLVARITAKACATPSPMCSTRATAMSHSWARP